MKAEDNILNLRDREPKQGEQFTEPKIGGLYPVAATVAGGAALLGLCAYLAL